jgi:hypothetical protein
MAPNRACPHQRVLGKCLRIVQTRGDGVVHEAPSPIELGEELSNRGLEVRELVSRR